MQTPARSESTSLSAPRGGRCRLLMRSAGSLVSRLVTTGWAVVVSPPPRDFAPRRCSFVSGCQMRCGASVTCAPLRRHQVACFPRACPYPAAALLCHLGPLLHFRKSASGCCQPTPAGGPLAADLSNHTRRASRQYPAPPGPTRCRGSQGICPLPRARTALGGPPRGAQLQLQLGCSQPSTLRAAWNQRRAAVAGWGSMQARCIGPATGRASPPERFLPVCSLPIHRRARLAPRACCATKHDNCAGVSVA
jgi:hypothetical protein